MLTRRKGVSILKAAGYAALLAAAPYQAVADDLSDEALLYADLLSGGVSTASNAPLGQGERWISFSSSKSDAWSAEQANAMKEAFRLPEKAATPTSLAPAAGEPKPYDALVKRFAGEFGVDPLLVHQVIAAESNYDPNAVSPKGAKGLMQLMDALSLQFNINPFDPASNIKVGVRYLAGLLKRFERVDLALAAYNAGPGAVEKYEGIPPYEETQSYVSKITASLAVATGR